MENSEIDWIKNLLNAPTREEVTAKSVDPPLRSVKKRCQFVSKMLRQIEQPQNLGHYLLVTDSQKPERWFEIQEKKQGTIIGRGSSADLILDQREISREHICIKFEPQGLQILDLDSKNGLIVNHKKVIQKFLCNGDIIHVGKTFLVYYINHSHEI